MTAPDRRTKAQLAAALDALQIRHDREARRAQLVDREAAAIDACVAVLKPLVEQAPRIGAPARRGAEPSIARVLSYLAVRFGVADEEVRR